LFKELTDRLGQLSNSPQVLLNQSLHTAITTEPPIILAIYGISKALLLLQKVKNSDAAIFVIKPERGPDT
jgi:hypothetical protein